MDDLSNKTNSAYDDFSINCSYKNCNNNTTMRDIHNTNNNDIFNMMKKAVTTI